MIDRINLFVGPFVYFFFVFSLAIGIFEYFDATVYKKEVAILLGLAVAALCRGSKKYGPTLLKPIEDYYIVFWISLPAPMINIYWTLVYN